MNILAGNVISIFFFCFFLVVANREIVSRQFFGRTQNNAEQRTALIGAWGLRQLAEQFPRCLGPFSFVGITQINKLAQRSRRVRYQYFHGDSSTKKV